MFDSEDGEGEGEGDPEAGARNSRWRRQYMA